MIGVAVVVPRGARTEVTLESLRSFATGRLAAYKLPEDLVVTEALPLTTMEKLDRTALAGLAASTTAERHGRPQ